MSDPVSVSVSATRERVSVAVDAVREVVKIMVTSDAYVLPTASDTVLGGIKVGSGLTITSGVLSADAVAGPSISVWNYKAKTNATSGYPSDGHLLWNNATQTNATSLLVSHINDDGTDIELILGFIQQGEKIFIQDRDDSAQNQIWQVSGTPTLTGGGTSEAYFTFPVTLVSIAGSAFSNNQQLLLGLTQAIPIASASVLGGIKSSDDILVDVDGVATVNGVTDGSGSADAGKFIKLGTDGQFSLISDLSEGFIISASASAGATAVSAASVNGVGLFGQSQDGIGARIFTGNGDYHAAFGSTTAGDNRSFVARLLGAFGWWRGAYKGLIQAAATLTANRTWILPDKDGTVAMISDITGTNSGTNTGDETVTTIATKLNAGTEDTAAADTDKIAVTSPAGGWMSLTTLWTWITGKLSAAFYRPLIVKKSTAQMDVTSSTTYVDITGLTGYSLEADTVYQAVFFGQVTCGASGGYKVQISSSAALFHTASGSHGFGSMNQIGATVGALFQLNSTDIIVNSRTAAGTAAPFMTIFCFRTGASAPTVKFMFAQNASNATTSSLLTGAVGSIQKLI